MPPSLGAIGPAEDYLAGGRPWRRALLLDVGSTFTKALVIDERANVLGRAQAPTTIERDVLEGASAAIAALPAGASGAYDWALACSSAAGGLRMVSVGLTASLSGKAGVLAALGAGAKLVSSEHGQLGEAALERMESACPHLVLLAGGTDGGNAEALLHNARMLSRLTTSLGFVVAGNACAAPDAARILQRAHHDVIVVDNVFPRPGEITIRPTREAVRELFLRHITKAKGLEGLLDALATQCEPTPLAVSRTLSVLAHERGPVVFVDLGGATTDVHSAGGRLAERRNAELPTPDVMRTVEGDLGMRWGAPGTVAAMSEGRRRAIEAAHDCDLIGEAMRRHDEPGFLPQSDLDRGVDKVLARAAVTVAIERHAGRVVVRHRPWGDRYQVIGKDLRDCRVLIATGGVFRHVERPDAAVDDALAEIEGVHAPEAPAIVIDDKYALYAIGLLARLSPPLATALARNALGLTKRGLFPFLRLFLP